jgi:hypothetical protein
MWGVGCRVRTNLGFHLGGLLKDLLLHHPLLFTRVHFLFFFHSILQVMSLQALLGRRRRLRNGVWMFSDLALLHILR